MQERKRIAVTFDLPAELVRYVAAFITLIDVDWFNSDDVWAVPDAMYVALGSMSDFLAEHAEGFEPMHVTFLHELQEVFDKEAARQQKRWLASLSKEEREHLSNLLHGRSANARHPGPQEAE